LRGLEKRAGYGLVSGSISTLVCFAVKEEARYFEPVAGRRPQVRSLVTGMGRVNAEKAFRNALAEGRPDRVLTCGFAGGLSPDLKFGTVVFDVDSNAGVESVLVGGGAVPGRFVCVDEVVATAARKRELRAATGASAVEMESEAIRSVCREQGITSGTVRVILDTADEDLPLDFNLVLNAGTRIDPAKLAWLVIKSPSKIGGLMRLRRRTETAAKRLAEVLERTM